MKGNHERAWREKLHAEATAMSDTATVAPTGTASNGRTTATVRAWDPYEVWLNRVKLPRDRRIVTETR